MDSEVIKNNDPIQLQQMIIFLRAELAKYKNEVKRLRDSDYYELILRLERENVHLTKLKKDLSIELLKLTRDYEKERQAYNEEIQRRELQRKKQITSIESLLKELVELRADNKVLKESIKEANKKLLSLKKEASYKVVMEGVDKKLNDFTIATGRQIESIIQAIEKSAMEQAQSDSLYQHLVQELTLKNQEIERLSNKIVDAQKQSTGVQIISFNKQIDDRLRMLDELDKKINALTLEINRAQI
ncbi:hypothetical protein I6G82_21080 [Lysinibacillus macroides]|uniref:Uncharacterized protein n=1 Tax=Lysinibacillus macroides TaxID=33935 RepID=A0A0M9DHA5_9BACI|nr:hypothetical protein [Lysinibacillus macroides]KOY80350.1 hypothetical protein ADM90_21165 [Lysinibacillus macroides]QPR67660.1 hypothetical protein I6G82_21080 [Lysinibacillus macroides]